MKPVLTDLLKNPALLLATWFGCGLSPKAPGTAGSVGALPFCFFVHYFYGSHALLAFSVFTFFTGWWAANGYLKKYDKTPDPGAIVIDEVAGVALTLSALFPTWQSYLMGFLLFRFFDIVKPWPVSWADRNIKGGLGVMVDDMVAGIYPAFIMLLATPIMFLIGKERFFSSIFDFLAN